MPLSPLSTVEGGAGGKIIGEKGRPLRFAAENDRPRHPQPFRAGAGAGIGPQAEGFAAEHDPPRHPTRQRAGGVAADGRQAVLVPLGSGRRPDHRYPDHTSPFPDCRRPAVAAKRVKVERQ
ncbi:hypothetical protein GCM10028793_16110 [Nocardiopsis oceani]